MKCRYCKQKLNLFKSLAGSSFCSTEHQKLYEEAEANKGFERLLQFVERDAKPTSPLKPSVPPPATTVEVKAAPPLLVPESLPIEAKTEKAPDAAHEAPMAGFMLEPIASPAVSVSSKLEPNFEVAEAEVSTELPALPSFRFAVATDDLQTRTDDTPPPPAGWSNVSPARIDCAKTAIEVASVSSVRPRAIDLAVPSAESHVPAAGALPVGSFSDSGGLQVSVQVVIDTQEFAHLARLNALPAEPRLVNETAHRASAQLGAPVLSQPDVMVLNAPWVARDSREVTIDMSGAMTRTGGGRKISPPDLHRLATPCVLAGLPRPTLASLNFGQTDRPAPVAMNGAMMRAVVAKAVRQPQAPVSRFLNTLGSNQILNPLSAGVQNASRQRGCSTLPPRPIEHQCIVPEGGADARESTPGIPPVIAYRRLTIHKSDTMAAHGITDATKPAAVSSPLFVPNVPGFRRSIKIAVERVVREIPVAFQGEDGWHGCAISPARPTRRDCLRPALLWSAKSGLGSEAASLGWFHESDCTLQNLAPGPPCPRQFSIRFAPESFQVEVPALGCDRISRRLALAVCEWKGEAQRLAHSQPSRTSPLSLVARPQTRIMTFVARQVAGLNQFVSIVNPAYRGADVSAPAAASSDEHKPTLALPQTVGCGLELAFRLSSQAALKSQSIQAAQLQNSEIASRPQPSPLRVQPASMLVLPGSSITTRRIRWTASGGWATVASPSLPKQEFSPVSSSEQSNLSSLRCVADAVRVDRDEIQESRALRLNAKRPVISLDFAAQTSAHGVPAAHALPRRSGPKLPVVKAYLDDLNMASR